MKFYNKLRSSVKATFFLIVCTFVIIFSFNSCKKASELSEELDKFVDGKFAGIFKDADGWEIELVDDPDGSLNGSLAVLVTKGSYKAGSSRYMYDNSVFESPSQNLTYIASHMYKHVSLKNTWEGNAWSSDLSNNLGKVTVENNKATITLNNGTPGWVFTYDRPGVGWEALKPKPKPDPGTTPNGPGVIGTWYGLSCGDSKGVKLQFGTDGKGSFSNKDCNGICNPIVFTFKYTVSGSTIAFNYDSVQPIVKCSGYADSRPPAPKNGSMTFSVSGNKLTTNGKDVYTR